MSGRSLSKVMVILLFSEKLDLACKSCCTVSLFLHNPVEIWYTGETCVSLDMEIDCIKIHGVPVLLVCTYRNVPSFQLHRLSTLSCNTAFSTPMMYRMMPTNRVPSPLTFFFSVTLSLPPWCTRAPSLSQHPCHVWPPCFRHVWCTIHNTCIFVVVSNYQAAT